MLDLVFTNDWELYGDGSGDYYQVQHNPTLSLLDFLASNNAGMTFFVEIGQQITFKNSGIEKYQNIAADWEKILNQALENPLNDVQMHIHPQWFFAEFDGNYWKLPDDKWSIGKLPTEKAKELISLGKSYIEEVLSPHNYKCEVFRAGAYYIEPSGHIINILEELGFKADTSVTKGRKVSTYYDFTDAESNIMPWNVADSSVKHKGNRKLKEFPIYSKKLNYSEALNKFLPKLANKFHYGIDVPQDELDWIKERDRVKDIRYPRANRPYKKAENKNLSWYLSKFMTNNYVQLDYDYLPASVFVKFLEDILKKYPNQNLPIVSSGHIKDAHSNYNLEKIIKTINDNFKNQINITNFRNILSKY